MDLSSEDTFRLNVLLANQPQAIRIDESRMIVYGLGPGGEATVRLNPNCRPEQYLRRVKELISGHVMGSPGGYPVYLRRWTRMGQMREESLEQLLLLGESEAVVAAVCSPGLSDELARRAWWAMEDAENARQMLRNPAVVAGTMGPRLAAYLVEYLPFETESEKAIESIRLVLQPGLISADERAELWKKSGRKQAYLVGFLQALPDDLPDRAPGRAREPALAVAIADSASQGNRCARLFARIDSGAGQTFLKTVATVLAKPPSQDVVTTTFDCLRGYFADLGRDADPDCPLEDLIVDAEGYASIAGSDADVAQWLREWPALAGEVAAMRVLSGVGYGVIRPVLRDSTALGSLMRRKLAPVIEPVQQRLGLLLGATSGKR